MKPTLKNLVLLGILFMMACGMGGVSSRKGTKADTISAWALVKKLHQDSIAAKNIKDTAKQADDNNGLIDNMEDTAIVPIEIKYNLYTFHPVCIGDTFDCDSALQRLYPGQFYDLWTDKYQDSEQVFEAWSCPLCTKHVFHGWVDPDSNGDVFPLRDSNETKVGDTLSFKLADGRQCIIISFATTEFQEDFIGMGRFSGAYMGLALFTKEKKGWTLEAFNPAIGYYGMFEDMPNISRFMYSPNNPGCYIGDMEQGAGGPDYIDAYLFAVSGHTFKIVLQQGAVARGNRERDVWDSYQYIDSSQIAKDFPDIIFTTWGDYLKSGFDSAEDGEDTSVTLPEIKRIIKHKDNFDFTITSRYTYNGNEYKFVNESMSTQPHKSDTNKKPFKAFW